MTKVFALLLALTGLATLGVVAALEANGVPAPVIFMDHAGLDTSSSMWRARHVFGASRIVVVTQRFHLARATPRRPCRRPEGRRPGDGRLRIFAT